VTGALPSAFITLGGAGSGKSTVSKHLSKMTGAVYLDKDTMSGALVQASLEALGHEPTDRESNPTYVERIMPLEYRTLFAVAADNLALGHSVVLDAPFVAYLSDPAFLSRSTVGAGWPATDVHVVHVRASAEIVRARLKDRGLDRDRAKLADWDAYWARFGELDCAWEGVRHTTIRNADMAQVAVDLERFVIETSA
jgi:predicted kinase